MEMMVVIAIIGIILAIALPAYSSWRERTALRSAADALMAHLKQARHLAIAENRSVSVVFSTNQYVFDQGAGQPHRNKTVNLSGFGAVTLASTFPGGALTFTSRGTAPSGTITLSSGGASKTITVNVIGRAYAQ